MGEFKVHSINAGGTSGFKRYRSLCYGNLSLAKVFLAELIALSIGWMPGALGLALRKLAYPLLFDQIGRGVIFGRNMTIRHPHKIKIGNGVIFDDNVVIDAKGDSNKGIEIGDGVYVGRNSIVYCKNGDIRLGDKVNVSANCQLYSSNLLEVGEGTVIAAYTYMMSGGMYDYADPTPFCDQDGMKTQGACRVGADCWIGAGVNVLDGVEIGPRCVIAAGAVVNRSIPGHSLAGGVPAKLIRSI